MSSTKIYIGHVYPDKYIQIMFEHLPHDWKQLLIYKRQKQNKTKNNFNLRGLEQTVIKTLLSATNYPVRQVETGWIMKKSSHFDPQHGSQQKLYPAY